MAKNVLIVGGGIAGLSAAIHAKLRGYDVLLLESGNSVGGKAGGIEQDGYRLDPGPSIVILKHVYERLFRDAGRKMSDYLTFDALQTVSRTYLEGHRGPIDLPAGKEDCLRVLNEVVPEDAEAVQQLLDTLEEVAPGIEETVFERPFDKPWQLLNPKLARAAMKFNPNQTYKQTVDEMFQSDLLRAFFYGFPSYGGQTYDAKSIGAFLIPYYMIAEGTYYPKGGVAAIPEALRKLATDLGVEVRTGVSIQAFQTQKKRLAAAFDTEAKRYEADKFIVAFDRITAERMLGRTRDPKPSFSYYTVHWGLKRRLSGTAHHVLTVPKNYEQGFEQLYRERVPASRPIVYLNDATATDPTVAPEGRTNLFAVVTTPSVEPHFDWDKEGDRLKSAIRHELDRFGLGFGDDEIEMERVQSPKYFRDRHGNYCGTLYGVDDSERLWGLFPLRNRDEHLDNLYYCGGSVQPGAGLPMVTLSGRFAAQML